MMYSKNYILKCRKADDLQAVWTQRIGDYFVTNTDEIQILDVNNYQFCGIEKWVPTSDQLGWIYNQKKSPLSDLKLLSAMRIETQRCYCSSFLQKQSIPEMWLMFVMKALFNKEWNSSKEKWD